MNTLVPYQIVVPSHARRRLMPELLKKVPDALITVNESEVDEYSEVVPDEQLLPHPNMSRLPKIRNWILDNVDAPAIIMMDDDFQFVTSIVWKTPQKTAVCG